MVTTPTDGEPDVVVVGAGVSGLTCAVALVEIGIRVLIVAAAMPAATTSMAAGALWGPYLVEPQDRVLRWSAWSLAAFTRLAADPATGVKVATGIEAARHEATPPNWAATVEGYRVCSRSELPSGFVTGWQFSVPLIDMPTYLTYLAERFQRAGGRLQQRSLATLDEASLLAAVVVNCSGIGARELVPDGGVTSVRGQLLVVENPGLDRFFSEDTGSSPDLLCIYPHGDEVILGGTAEPGVWTLEPDYGGAAQILERCAQIVPELRTSAIREHRVGLRPTRDRVRVEAVRMPPSTARHEGWSLIHNYGHGGAGVTLSWGCAQEVTESVLELVHPLDNRSP